MLSVVVLLGGYTFLYVMVHLWSGDTISFHDALLGGCGA